MPNSKEPALVLLLPRLLEVALSVPIERTINAPALTCVEPV